MDVTHLNATHIIRGTNLTTQLADLFSNLQEGKANVDVRLHAILPNAGLAVDEILPLLHIRCVFLLKDLENVTSHPRQGGVLRLCILRSDESAVGSHETIELADGKGGDLDWSKQGVRKAVTSRHVLEGRQRDHAGNKNISS